MTSTSTDCIVRDPDAPLLVAAATMAREHTGNFFSGLCWGWALRRVHASLLARPDEDDRKALCGGAPEVERDIDEDELRVELARLLGQAVHVVTHGPRARRVVGVLAQVRADAIAVRVEGRRRPVVVRLDSLRDLNADADPEGGT